MKRLLYLFLGLLFVAGAQPPERLFYVDVPLSDAASYRRLVEDGYDVGGIDLERKRVTLVVPESGIGILGPLRVLDIRAIPFAPDAKFKKPEDVERFLRKIEADYPQLARLEEIGQSVEGRDILAIQLTNRFVVPPEGGKPTVLFDAMHHAREVMTPEVAMDIVDYLTSRFESDPKVQEWLNRYEIWVVPMVNPDGNNRVWNASSMWRKNTRGGYGVDVNRNYPKDWGTCNGSSGDKSSEIYRGTAPASEPETQALMELAARIKPKFNISYHTFSEIVIYPFGCSPKRIPSPDRELYERIGRELAGKLVRDSGTGSYRPGTAYELLYNADGGSVDWMYDEHKIMSFVIEVNSSAQGFQPSYQWRDITVERQRKGWQYLLDQMDGPGLQGGPSS